MRGCLKEHKVFSVTPVDQILGRLFILFPSSHFEGVSHWLEIVFLVLFFFSPLGALLVYLCKPLS